MATKVARLKIRGQDFDVLVSESGEFLANLDNDQLRAPTLEGLKNKLTAATRAKSVTLAVEFEKLDDDGKTYPGVVYGIHTNRNLLVRYDGAKKSEQERDYNMRDVARRLTPEERTEWAQLRAAYNGARRRVEQFKTRTYLDVAKKAREEMAKLTGAPEADDV